MLTQICQYLRNYFVRETYIDTFAVRNGAIEYADGDAPPLVNGQYYRIIGSLFNDGVHKFGVEEVEENNSIVERLFETLTDEAEFSGAVWSMAVPPVVVQLDKDIDDWITANADALNTPYQSESFGGYSYSLKTGSAATGDSGGLSWMSQFASRLAPWRKI